MLKKWQIKNILATFSNFFFQNLDIQSGIYITPKYLSCRKAILENEKHGSFKINSLLYLQTNEFMEAIICIISEENTNNLNFIEYENCGFVLHEYAIIISGSSFTELIVNINNLISLISAKQSEHLKEKICGSRPYANSEG